MKLTPLNAVHRQLGGRMVEFGGWEMPVQYKGILDEHKAVRERVGWIENVRAQRGPAEVGGGGATISAPSTGAAVAIAGGAMLTIAAAAFALRRRREPGLA